MSTIERGPSLVWYVGLVVLVQEIYPALAAIYSRPVQNIFSLNAHFFSLCVPWAGSHARSPVSRYCPARKEGGQEVYQSIGLAAYTIADVFKYT
jgi:hypothetical protein